MFFGLDFVIYGGIGRLFNGFVVLVCFGRGLDLGTIIYTQRATRCFYRVGQGVTFEERAGNVHTRLVKRFGNDGVVTRPTLRFVGRFLNNFIFLNGHFLFLVT